MKEIQHKLHKRFPSLPQNAPKKDLKCSLRTVGFVNDQ